MEHLGVGRGLSLGIVYVLKVAGKRIFCHRATESTERSGTPGSERKNVCRLPNLFSLRIFIQDAFLAILCDLCDSVVNNDRRYKCLTMTP
jgi:hypothetical protein